LIKQAEYFDVHISQNILQADNQAGSIQAE
jgi:hypothetical protein